MLTALQAEFQSQVLYIKEQQRMREEEIEGGWYTEEKMQKELLLPVPGFNAFRHLGFMIV